MKGLKGLTSIEVKSRDSGRVKWHILGNNAPGSHGQLLEGNCEAKCSLVINGDIVQTADPSHPRIGPPFYKDGADD